LAGCPRLGVFKTRQPEGGRAKKPEWEKRGVFRGKKRSKREKERKKRRGTTKMGGGEWVFHPNRVEKVL
jgi:hypothetical protein